MKYSEAVLILFSVFTSLQLWAGNYTHLNYNCHIHDLDGNRLRTMPGNLCQFFSDGSFASATHNDLKYIDKDNNVVWSHPGDYHHQLNLTVKGERFLALSRIKSKDQKGEPLNVDHFLILDKQGKVVHETTADKLVHKTINYERWSKYDLSHFNSFHEIPNIVNPKVPDYIKQGNFVVNNYRDGIYVLSSDLQTVLHYQKFATSDGHYLHDVQVLPNGNYFYFNNQDARSTPENRFSSVQELDHRGKVVFSFPKKPTPLFFSVHQGGAQKVNDDLYLITSASAGTYLYSRKQDKVIQNIYKTHFQNSMFFPLQEARLLDLADFLKNRK